MRALPLLLVLITVICHQAYPCIPFYRIWVSLPAMFIINIKMAKDKGVFYNTVSEMRFPNPEKIRKSVESCTSAWPFSIFEI